MSKELVTKSETLLDLIATANHTGLESVEQDCLSMPFLRIAQTNTNQAQKGDPAQIKDLEPGMFFNTLTGNVYGEKIKIVLLDFFRTFNEWGQEIGDFRGSHTKAHFERDLLPNCTKDRSKWITPEDTRIIDTRSFYALLPDHLEDGLVIYALYGSGLSHSRRILDRANTKTYTDKNNEKKVLPLWMTVYELETEYNKDGKESWYNIGQKSHTNVKDLGQIPEDFASIISSNLDFIKVAKTKQLDFSIMDNVDTEAESF